MSPCGLQTLRSITPLTRKSGENATLNLLVGLSSFKVDRTAQPQDWLISELETIELHHGEFSHDPPWSRINVIGTKWTERIHKELERLWFKSHLDTPDGFEAAKESV